ncbi:unnamed protein product [Rotaria socialis]|uniref:Uncharacterized protein n=1 Tax=Rotaria socialis TaxID=392032 RepID=A0A821GTQ4_9BILA|nr:unnamed protein product [Rotaria socialis]CAF4676270.1 unnamed protein product [Rotaria socialis]CAF4834424.1 unnamed protein product [Rotaria socialis]
MVEVLLRSIPTTDTKVNLKVNLKLIQVLLLCMLLLLFPQIAATELKSGNVFMNRYNFSHPVASQHANQI